MNKIVRKFAVEHDLDLDYDVEIKTLIEDLRILEENGATHISLEVVDDYGFPSTDIKVYEIREETDKECERRLSEEQACKDIAKKRDLEQLRRLQEKYK